VKYDKNAVKVRLFIEKKNISHMGQNKNLKA
jgi:hypothetical protein